MPRKAKENEEIKDNKIEKGVTTKKTTTTSKKNTTKAATAKKATTVKKSAEEKSTTKKETKVATSKRKSASTKKTTKSASTKSKTSLAKKQSKSTSAKTRVSSTKRKITKKSLKQEPVAEYYDLPYKYNKTVIKLLAQTPKTLFVYWEISDEDIENYKKQFGENFFETTKPVLRIYNKTLNYSFEVEINDFANSWYLHVNDSKSDYKIELGRRPIQYNENIKNDYIYITSSNEIESPNDHILFNTSQKMVYFRNVKTNIETSKDVFTLSFMRNIGKIYHIYDIKDLYKELYKHEDNIENLSNPSSNTSSQFK